MTKTINHITELLSDKGYKTYCLINKSNWNKDVKKQAEKIYEAMFNKNIVFEYDLT